MDKKFVVDSIEGDIVSLEAEDGSILKVDRNLLPTAVAEGDIVRIFIDHEQTGRKKEQIQNLLNDILG